MCDRNESTAPIVVTRQRVPCGLVRAVRLIACLGAGVLLGAQVAGILTPVGGQDRVDVPCEYDRCGGFFIRGCEDAGNQNTNCYLHAFGCGTIPCGTTFATLATFESPRSSELWMAFGPAAILPLTEYVMDDDYRHRVEALRTLVGMARDWDVNKLDHAPRRAMEVAAARFTYHPLDHIPPEQRVATLLLGIDLAMALDTRFLTASVQALRDPDTVRVRLVDDELDHRAVVRHARRAR